MSNKLKKIAIGGVVALATAAGLAAMAPGSAQAATASPAATARNGVCESGEFCLYYFPTDLTSSVSDFNTSISNYGDSQPTCYEFRGPGSGQGQCVKNNAMSVWNRTSHAVTVYYHSGYGEPSQTFAAGQRADLNSTLSNENAGHLFR